MAKKKKMKPKAAKSKRSGSSRPRNKANSGTGVPSSPVHPAPVVPFTTWSHLANCVGKDCPLLQCDPLYPLPPGLLEIIQYEVPDVLGDLADAERGLSEFCKRERVDGFFHQQPLTCEILQFDQPDMLRPAMMENYRKLWPDMPEARIRKMIQRSDADWEEATNSLRGYVGWLFQNETFTSELLALKEQGEDYVRQHAGFPGINWLSGDVSASDESGEKGGAFALAYRDFCRKWCLFRLVTWDVPEPTGPQLPVSTPGLHKDVAAQGFTLFVPFSFLFPRKLNLHDLAKNRLGDLVPEHLHGWVNGKTWAWQSDAQLFRFNHFWNTMEQRHAERFRNNRTRLKKAIGKYLVAPDLEHSNAVIAGADLSYKLFTRGKAARELALSSLR